MIQKIRDMNKIMGKQMINSEKKHHRGEGILLRSSQELTIL